ncbi:Eco57I restriction-modification methylase domain-containing protein [Infirmifilum lucidum]|nr:class I SAM-dependent DNA methyltransferase [Infirmifilum lucidum]
MSFKGIDIDNIIHCIRDSVHSAHTEEDLRVRVSACIEEKIIKPLGITTYGKYEYTLVSGVRPDALYGHVIVEYKAPGKLSREGDIARAKEQVINYIMKEARSKEEWGRYLGIIISDRIAFVRYDRPRNQWILRGPYEISRETLIKVIEAIRGLSRKSLDADHLLEDFGSKSPVARQVVRVLYRKLSEALNDKKHAKVEVLFQDWLRLFRQATGYDPEKLKEIKELAELYSLAGKVNYDRLLFSVHTYFALIMKLLAAEVVYLYGRGKFLKSYVAELEDAYMQGGSEALRNMMTELEGGGLFRKLLGITNFLEGDYFAWYLEVLDEELADAVALVLRTLENYEPATPHLEPEFTRDLFKRLYQNLIPGDLRHHLGEYYTPDWLAELVLDEVGLTDEKLEEMGRDDPLKPLGIRVLDPACGSGTFLIAYLKRLRMYAEKHFLLDVLAEYALKNVVGYDLNPLAVLTARANYLLAIGDLLAHVKGEHELPVYLADSIMVEARSTLVGQVYVLRTAAGHFEIPVEVVEGNLLNEILGIIEETVPLKYSEEEFASRLRRKLGKDSNIVSALKDLYRTFRKLEEEGKDRVWASILRNTFAPLVKGKFDYVVGNPPWVNWENLPEEYRKISEFLWKKYGLLGRGRGLGKVKRDLAMLFLARCFDLYLRDGGILGFLIPFTVFKTQAGAGFRSYIASWKINMIHDTVTLYPFEGAVNRASAIVVEKSRPTTPSRELKVRHVVWINKYGGPIPTNMPLEEVLKVTRREEMVMMPLGKTPDAPWMQITEKAKRAVEKVLNYPAPRTYEAHAGVYTAFNQIYYVKVLDKDGYLIITNPPEPGQKKSAKQVTVKIEPDLVYPLIRGRDVKKWRVSYKDRYAIVPHDPKTGKPIPEENIKMNCPKTYEYFYTYKSELENRSIHRLWGKDNPFYSVYDIGAYTFALYKVVWKRIAGAITGKATEFACAVAGPKSILDVPKPVIPDDGTILIPLDNADEAYYIAGVLNSTIARAIIASYTYELRQETHIVENVKIPKYAGDDVQKRIAELSKKAHELAEEIYGKGRNYLTSELSRVESELDRAVAQLYGITEEELEEIKRVYNILRGEFSEEESEEEEEVFARPSVYFVKTDVRPGVRDYITVRVSTEGLGKLKLSLKAPWGMKELVLPDGEHKIEVPPLERGNYSVGYSWVCGEYSGEGSVDIVVGELKSPKRGFSQQFLGDI